MSVFFDNRQQEKDIDSHFEKQLERVINIALELEGVIVPVEVSISFVSNEEIQELNREYRNKNTPTDVLSFPLVEREDLDNMVQAQEEILLGDIIISISKALEQAEEYGHSFSRELSYLTVHGIYHLLGYDHMTQEEKKAMREKEEAVMEALQINR
ncbi:rRNA maturation RNase YbeY [Irregularibacter muris]|uniref:Endoribonuclease YbeY n=1 Tax=Irregularibacter muris TaxID=1796619 RepID=A0AAE3HE84_9FIRM|nr:rRNA maturation RNase YbeY [Irregularibacter muris]MCR1897860.1 rRNA maturation RNase YbeY [Irregularibacter muris]